MAKTAVAVKETTSVTILPEWMKQDIGLGTENIGASDTEVPRIKLCQKISPELDTFNDLKAGDFFHTLAEKSLGREVRVTPIYTDIRYILWRPQDTGGGILARADDGVHWSPSASEFEVELKKGGPKVKWRTAKTVAQSGLADWGSSNPADPNSPPAATRMYNLVVTLPDYPDLPPAVVTLQRASIGVARKLMGKLKITRAPSFGLYFKMASFSDKNGAGQEFLNYAFTADGIITDQEEYDKNRAFYDYFKSQGVNIKDMEGLQDEPTNTGALDGAAPF